MKIIKIFTEEAKERLFHWGELDITCVEWKTGKQITVFDSMEKSPSWKDRQHTGLILYDSYHEQHYILSPREIWTLPCLPKNYWLLKVLCKNFSDGISSSDSCREKWMANKRKRKRWDWLKIAPKELENTDICELNVINSVVRNKGLWKTGIK